MASTWRSSGYKVAHERDTIPAPRVEMRPQTPVIRVCSLFKGERMQSSRRERQSGEPSEIKKEEGHSVTDLTKGRENRTEMSRKTRTLPGRLSGEGFRSISNMDSKEIRPVHPKGNQS